MVGVSLEEADRYLLKIPLILSGGPEGPCEVSAIPGELPKPLPYALKEPWRTLDVDASTPEVPN